MEPCSGDQKKEPLLSSKLEVQDSKQGGFKTLPFIIANESFEKVASYGLLPNMIVYLMRDYGMEASQAAKVLNFWSAATNFLPVLGAVLADSYVGRFQMIGFGSIASVLGTILLWLTTIIPETKPPPCDKITNICIPPTTFQIMFLYSSLGLMSIGASGIRSSSLAFGAYQLDKTNNLNNAKTLGSYFSWYYAFTSLSAIVAVTGVVYVQDSMGWALGFGVPVILMCLAALAFFLASPLYAREKVNTSLFTSLAQVLVASYRNRKAYLPSQSITGVYHQKRGSMLLQVPSEKLRFLNKACIVGPNNRGSDPWSVCTVSQVEDLKTLIRIIPMWSAGIAMSVVIGQSSFLVLLASSMNRHLTKNFEIPAGSFSVFLVVTLTLWISLYDSILVPAASRIMGKPVRLGLKDRMGTGLVLSCLCVAAVAIVESVRREAANQEGYTDEPEGVVDMSAMWLVPHFVLAGLAEAFNAIAQNEFYYSELPKTMSSIATALFGLGMSIGNLVAGFIVSIVDDVTKSGGQESWVSSNINKAHYDYFYWLLTALSSVNLIYFLACCKAYGPCQPQGGNTSMVRVSEEDEENLSN